jgi:GntP family gluconate:H+ symporter
MTIATILYAKHIGMKIYQLPTENGLDWERHEYQKPVYDFQCSILFYGFVDIVKN